MTTLLRKVLIVLMVVGGVFPAAAAQRQIVGGTTTITFTPAFLEYFEGFPFPAVSVFGNATMPDAATVVLTVGPGITTPEPSAYDPDEGFLFYQHGGGGFTLIGEGVAYLFDPVIYIGTPEENPFGLPDGTNYLFASIAGTDGSVPSAPTFVAPVFTFPLNLLTGGIEGNVLTLNNIQFSFLGGGTLGELGVVATATSRLELAAVPEPATWVLLIGGFGLVGVALRRQPKRMLPAATRTSTS